MHGNMISREVADEQRMVKMEFFGYKKKVKEEKISDLRNGCMRSMKMLSHPGHSQG